VQGSREQLERRGGFHHNPDVRPQAEQRVNHFDGARRMPEAVPGDVKDDAI
jgi:hypothetical protein